VKLGLKGERIVQVAPEFEDCRVASERSGIPLRLVYDAALHAWQSSAPTHLEEVRVFHRQDPLGQVESAS
jgi:hypothetical protein